MHLTEGRESSTICSGASGAVSVNDLWRRLRRRIDDSAHCESVGLSVGTCRWTFHRSWISYANVRNYYGPYAHCSLDKGVACAQHMQLLAHTCACTWYECTLTSAHIFKCMQTQESLGNMKISGSHPCWHKQ